MCWFYLGDGIVNFYNEMGWDFTKLSESKKPLYSGEYEGSYKNYVIQDIWDRLLKEKDCEYLCWGVYNFIDVLQDTEEQKNLKNDLQQFMNELYQYTTDETEMNAGILSQYIKQNKGIDCTFGHIEIDIKNNRLGQGLTRKNDRMANWEFSAPEQVSGKKITVATDIYAFGQILYWFCFGTINRGTGGKHLQEIFDEEKAGVLDEIIYKSISNEAKDRYQSIAEIEKEFTCVQKKNVNVYADMYLFSGAIISIFPEAYKAPFVTDNKVYIRNLINKLNNTKFNQELWYNTGLANAEFREIRCLENGNYFLCDREIIIDEIWALVDDYCYNDILILKVSNPGYYVVDGSECSAIAIINNEIIEPLEKIESGYYRFSDGHVEPISDLSVEIRYTYKAVDDDKYIVIGVQQHCSIILENDDFICKIQKIDKLNLERIISLQKQISKHKTYEVQLGI